MKNTASGGVIISRNRKLTGFVGEGVPLGSVTGAALGVSARDRIRLVEYQANYP